MHMGGDQPGDDDATRQIALFIVRVSPLEHGSLANVSYGIAINPNGSIVDDTTGAVHRDDGGVRVQHAG